MLENFKLPSLANFDGCIDSYEYVASINTHMTIIETPDSLKCKLLSNTFRDSIIRWYMGLPQLSVIKCQDLVKKLVHQFSTSKHRKMASPGLFSFSSNLL